MVKGQGQDAWIGSLTSNGARLWFPADWFLRWYGRGPGWWWYLIEGEYNSSQPDIEHLTDHVISAKEGRKACSCSLVRHHDHMMSWLIIFDVAVLPSIPALKWLYNGNLACFTCLRFSIIAGGILTHLSLLVLGVSREREREVSK